MAGFFHCGWDAMHTRREGIVGAHLFVSCPSPPPLCLARSLSMSMSESSLRPPFSSKMKRKKKRKMGVFLMGVNSDSEHGKHNTQRKKEAKTIKDKHCPAGPAGSNRQKQTRPHHKDSKMGQENKTQLSATQLYSISPVHDIFLFCFVDYLVFFFLVFDSGYF